MRTLLGAFPVNDAFLSIFIRDSESGTNVDEYKDDSSSDDSDNGIEQDDDCSSDDEKEAVSHINDSTVKKSDITVTKIEKKDKNNDKLSIQNRVPPPHYFPLRTRRFFY